MSARELILGVDPGLTGALALYRPAFEAEAGHNHEVVEIIDTPVHSIGKKNFVDYYALGQWIDLRSQLIRLAVVEEVSAGPNDGRQSAFRFGETYGAIKGALGAHMVPMRLVKPAVWKRIMKLSSDKEQSRQAASRLFPSEGQELWPLKKHDGRAEALMLAVYATEVGL